MRSHGEGSQSATTQVKVLSPEIILFALGQGFHFLETNIGTPVRGEGETDVPGSESVAGRRIDNIGTWENRIVPPVSFREAGEATREYGDAVVGLIHNRGVGRVMSVESVRFRTLEGISSITQGDEYCDAVH